MHHIAALGPVQMDRPHSGALSTSIVEQVEALQAFYAQYLPQLALAASIPAAIAAFVLPISWAAGGLLLLTAPLIPLFMVLIGMGAENISQKHFQALSRMSAHFLDILQGLPTLKLLGRSRAEEPSIEKVSDDYRLRTMKVLRVPFCPRPYWSSSAPCPSPWWPSTWEPPTWDMPISGYTARP